MFNMIIFVFVIAFFIFAVGGIFLFASKHSKKSKKNSTVVFNDLSNKNPQPSISEPVKETPQQEKEEEIYCEFCGSRMDKKDKQCSQCGARRKK